MKKIALIGATGIDWWTSDRKRQFVEDLTPSGYEIGNFYCNYGTHSLESHADEAYNAPFILEQIVAACLQGFDGIVLDCACDPILDAAREVCTIPVVGPMQTAMHLALTLGRKFAIVTVEGKSLAKCMESQVRREGLDSFFVGVDVIDLPVLEIAEKPTQAENELIACAHSLVEQDADVIILGCTGLSHEVDLQRVMDAVNIPILDPLVIGVKTIAMLIESGLSHSKLAYPKPPKKPISEAPSLKGSFDDILKE
jgi:allantoin racemase